jgi:hypothetical protein
MAMQTCAALRKFDARSEMAETPIMPPLLDNECQACGKMHLVGSSELSET